MELLPEILQNIEAVTIGGISITLLTNSLTEAVKDKLPIDHKITPYIVGVILTLLGLGLGTGQVLAGIVVGFVATNLYRIINPEK